MSAAPWREPAFRLAGEGVLLRPLNRADATAAYASWLNDAETTRFLETRPGETSVATLQAYIKRRADRDDALLLGIFEVPGRRHVGNVKLEPIHWEHRRAVIGVLIGEPSARGRGVATRALRAVLEFAFGELELNRVELGVTADNRAAIACYERLGFTREGCLRSATRRGEGFVDNLWYGLLRADFRQDAVR